MVAIELHIVLAYSLVGTLNYPHSYALSFSASGR
jgi:hypothetical protein